ncbi:hypothetical protein V8D89_014545 [Ganoderma adspersum]
MSIELERLAQRERNEPDVPIHYPVMSPTHVIFDTSAPSSSGGQTIQTSVLPSLDNSPAYLRSYRFSGRRAVPEHGVGPRARLGRGLRRDVAALGRSVHVHDDDPFEVGSQHESEASWTSVEHHWYLVYDSSKELNDGAGRRSTGATIAEWMGKAKSEGRVQVPAEVLECARADFFAESVRRGDTRDDQVLL